MTDGKMIHRFKFGLFLVNLQENFLQSWLISTVMQRPFHFPMIPACYHTRTHKKSWPLQPFQAWLPIMWACLQGSVHRPWGVDRPRLLLPHSLLSPDNSHRLGVTSAWHLVTERGPDSKERSELQERPSHDVPTLTFTVAVILSIWKHRGEELGVGLLCHLNHCLRALTVVEFQEKKAKKPNKHTYCSVSRVSLQHLDSALHLQLRQFPTAWTDGSQEKQESWQWYCKKTAKTCKVNSNDAWIIFTGINFN